MPVEPLNTVSLEQVPVFHTLLRFITAFNADSVSQALCLTGDTGVSKSAMLHTAVHFLNESQSNPWGYRLVEIRAGFLDKADLVGFATVTDLPGIGPAFTDSPMLELVTASDVFITACRDLLTEQPDHPKAEQLRHYAATPVLFFDELNRAPESVMNQLMIIINSHRFSDQIEMTTAVKVAAMNMPLDDQGRYYEDDWIRYCTTEIHDPATLDRFKFIPVLGSGDLNQAVADYLACKYPRFAPLIHDLKASFYAPGWVADHEDSPWVGKFPTFRGWDYVFSYLDQILAAGRKTFCVDVIHALIGNHRQNGDLPNLVSRLRRDYKLKENHHPLEDECVQFNIPLLFLGRMGIAKTARINQAAQRHGLRPIYINLGTLDRTTVRGYPKRVPLIEHVFGQDPFLLLHFRQYLKMPTHTTIYIPKADIAQTVLDAYASGQKVLFIFDEINRCSSVVQSSVYECISEKRYMGVDLTGLDYTVAAAGNYDPYGDTEFMAGVLDSATLHRFAVKTQNTIEAADIAQVNAWVRSQGYHEAADILAEIPVPEQLELLNSSDPSDNPLASLFSLRTYTKLAQLLAECPRPIPTPDQVAEDISCLFHPDVLQHIHYLTYDALRDDQPMRRFTIGETAADWATLTDLDQKVAAIAMGGRVQQFIDQYLALNVAACVPPAIVAQVKRAVRKQIGLPRIVHNLFDAPARVVQEIFDDSEPNRMKENLLRRMLRDHDTWCQEHGQEVVPVALQKPVTDAIKLVLKSLPDDEIKGIIRTFIDATGNSLWSLRDVYVYHFYNGSAASQMAHGPSDRVQPVNDDLLAVDTEIVERIADDITVAVIPGQVAGVWVGSDTPRQVAFVNPLEFILASPIKDSQDHGFGERVTLRYQGDVHATLQVRHAEHEGTQVMLDLMSPDTQVVFHLHFQELPKLAINALETVMVLMQRHPDFLAVGSINTETFIMAMAGQDPGAWHPYLMEYLTEYCKMHTDAEYVSDIDPQHLLAVVIGALDADFELAM